jgi:hypothetical protein
MRSDTSIPQYVLMTWCSIKRGTGNFVRINSAQLSLLIKFYLLCQTVIYWTSVRICLPTLSVLRGHRMIVNNDLVRMLKEVVLTQFDALFRYFPWLKTHEILESRKLVSEPGFEHEPRGPDRSTRPVLQTSGYPYMSHLSRRLCVILWVTERRRLVVSVRASHSIELETSLFSLVAPDNAEVARQVTGRPELLWSSCHSTFCQLGYSQRR